MTSWPRHQVLALWLLGERYEADGWLEVRTRGPDLRWWESRCKVVGWNHQELSGSLPVSVRVELAAGGRLSGRAYVDQAVHHRGGYADLRIHGMEQGLKVQKLGPADYVTPARESLKQVLLVPVRVLVFLLVAAATVILLIVGLTLMFAPESLLPDRPGF